jgi:hypothetical protein
MIIKKSLQTVAKSKISEFDPEEWTRYN